ncbi:MAG: efflux RND transporter periplasmic adaptor subunit [Deltaproteobacteria bacterium]|nr:efflux RND transporter periplasmic adaptor subunit [Deltaproteobacteria bacterium]
MKRNRDYSTAALLLAMGLASTFACSKPEAVAERTLRAVRTVVAETSAAQRIRTFSGTSESSLQSRLSFKVSGTIEELPIEVGDNLKRGQVLARVDASQYQLEAQQAQASLVQAQASLRNAESSYERIQGLYENNNASRGDLDSARANAESGRAQVRSAEKQLELARLNVSYTRLRAAEDCSVATVDVEVNENINAGSTVAMVNCGDQLEVDLAIPEGLISGVDRGMAAEISFDALPGETFAGKVTEVGVPGQDSATFAVTVAILDQHEGLRPGLAAEVLFQFASSGRDDLVLIPLSAVAKDPAGSYVYLAKPAGDGEAVVARQGVQLGELTELGVEVLSGVSTGDLVITAGVALIQEGLRVRLQEGASQSGEGVSAAESQEG